MYQFAFVYALTKMYTYICTRMTAERFRKHFSQLRPASISTDLSSESSLLNLARYALTYRETINSMHSSAMFS